MSYCVNCGVELAPDLKSCPLCGVEVVNPVQPHDTRAPLFFPRKTTAEKRRINRMLGVVLFLISMIPVLICIICDLTDGAITWSRYVLSSMMLFDVIVVLPVYFSGSAALAFLGADLLASTVFVYTVERFSGGEWFYPFGLIVCLLCGGAVFMVAAVFTYRRPGRLSVTALIVMTAGVVCICIELALKICFELQLKLLWSPIVMVSCAFVGLILFIIDRSPSLKDEIKRRFFV